LGDWLQIDPEYQVLLSQTGLDNLDTLLAGGGGERVRHSLHTNVHRLESPTGNGRARVFYIKVRRQPWLGLRYLLRPSRALKEWRVLRRLRKRGIPAARPVAVGERRRRGALQDAVLVTEGIPESIDLLHFIPAFHQRPHTKQWARCKRRYLEALAHFTRSMHEAGYVSLDFHWRNVLIVEEPENPQFFLIDNPRGRFLPSSVLACRLGTRDLVALDRRASQYFTRTDRLRFLKAYAGARRLRDCVGLLRRVTRRSRKQGHERLTRAQTVTETTGPLGLVRDGCAWLAFRESAREDLAALGALRPTDLLYNHFDGEVLSRHSRRRVQRIAPSGAAVTLYVKRAISDRWLRDHVRGLLESRFAFGPYGREWRNLRVLEAFGLSVPTWLVFAQERAWGFVRREVLVLAEVTDAVPVARWLQGPVTLDQRRAFLRRLGARLARAHAGGFCFRNFSPEDIWVRPATSSADSRDQSQEAIVEPVFLDLERGRRRRRLRRRHVVRDLARLAASLGGLFSTTDALRFLQGYVGRRLTSQDKRLARSVLTRYQRLMDRLGRRLADTRPKGTAP